MEFLEMKNISEMENTVDELNSRFFTAEERIIEFAHMETIQNEDHRTSSFYLQSRKLQRMPFPL